MTPRRENIFKTAFSTSHCSWMTNWTHRKNKRLCSWELGILPAHIYEVNWAYKWKIKARKKYWTTPQKSMGGKLPQVLINQRTTQKARCCRLHHTRKWYMNGQKIKFQWLRHLPYHWWRFISPQKNPGINWWITKPPNPKIYRQETGHTDPINWMETHIYWWRKYKNFENTTENHQNFRRYYSTGQIMRHHLRGKHHSTTTKRRIGSHNPHHKTIKNPRLRFSASILLHTLRSNVQDVWVPLLIVALNGIWNI